MAYALFKMHTREFEHHESNINNKSKKIKLEHSSLYSLICKSIDESSRHGFHSLAQNMSQHLNNYKENYESMSNSNVNNSEKEANQLILNTNELDQIPSPQLASVVHIDTADFKLIDNLDDLALFLNEQEHQQQDASSSSPSVATNQPIMLDQSMQQMPLNFDFNASNLLPCQFSDYQKSPIQSKQSAVFSPTNNPKQLVTQLSQNNAKIADDQDKKIKTLADNIIAAMPHKIKTNSYSITNLSQREQLQQQNKFTSSYHAPTSSDQNQHHHFQNQMYNRNNNFNMLRRNATSFDDNYENSSYHQNNSQNQTGSHFRYNNNNQVDSCYSSSTRSSLSPTSSIISFQFNNNQHQNHQQHASNNINNSVGQVRLLDSEMDQYSPSCGGGTGVGDCDSSCSYDSTFHIDSPPSTAEFCQYFHASSASAKMAIETGFAQLTLTDDEQRELYEAALVIQNAYRRYILRKKKKIKLDIDELDVSSSNVIKQQGDNGPLSNKSTTSSLKYEDMSLILSRSSSTSLSSLASSNSFKSNSNQINTVNIQQNSNSLNQQFYIQTNLGNNMANNQQQQQQQQQQNIIPNEIHRQKSLKNSGSLNKSNELSDDDENNSSGEDQKQYQAACVIQKYYRRYRQVRKNSFFLTFFKI
jgi:hypothetical protein